MIVLLNNTCIFLQNGQIKVPVIVVGCKLDRRERDPQMSLEQTMAPIMQKFREIETCIECSASNLIQVRGNELNVILFFPLKGAIDVL